MVTKGQPRIENDPSSKVRTKLFLPSHPQRQGEGGLRTKGIVKKSLDNKPLVSVITVVFNGQKHLEQTIQSVINQSYNNVEYILIDGGSTDGTLDIIRKYEHVIDYWISEPDKDIYDAMNKGIELASGEWINFMNAGDSIFQTDCLEKSIGELKNQCLNFGFVVLSGSKNVRYIDFLTKNPICHQAIIYHKSDFSKHKFDIQYKIFSDYDHLMGIIFGKKIFRPATLNFLPSFAIQYGRNGISSKNINTRLRELLIVQKKYHTFFEYAFSYIYNHIRMLKHSLTRQK